jgi:hypothetical protein
MDGAQRFDNDVDDDELGRRARRGVRDLVIGHRPRGGSGGI